MATFKRYQAESGGDLLWGALLAPREDALRKPPLKSGDKLEVTKRNGKSKTVTVDKLISKTMDGALWSIVGGAKAKRGKYVPLDGKCNDCGKAIPSKYTQCLDCKPGNKRCPSCGALRLGICRRCEANPVSSAATEHEPHASDPFPEW